MKSINRKNKTQKKQSCRIKPEDVESVLYELDAWKKGQRGTKLTWGILERLSGFSRQSLWAKSEIKRLFDEVKEKLRKGINKSDSNQYRQTLEQRIESLEDEITRLKKQQNHWLELWARYEYNARIIGLDLTRLAQPLIINEK